MSKIFVFNLIIILSVISFVNAFSGDGGGSFANPYNITNCTQL